MTDQSKLAFVFPGQGSQSVGMMTDFGDTQDVVRRTYAEASEVLGMDLGRLVAEGPKELLDRTENTQPAMLAAGVAVWRCWQARGAPTPALMAGHSLGEYTALVCAGAIAFGDAVRLVAARGRLMQEAVPEGLGAMAAILGLDDDSLRRICEEQARGEVLAAVNFNAPGQVVIAGDRAAVERGTDAAKSAGAKRAIVLPVSVPSHCALMTGAAEKLSGLLAEIDVQTPRMPVLHNVTVGAATTPDEVRGLLARQLYSPVRWVETVQAMADAGITIAVEAGPGTVLTGLGKRIDQRVETIAVADAAGLNQALEAMHDA